MALCCLFVETKVDRSHFPVLHQIYVCCYVFLRSCKAWLTGIFYLYLNMKSGNYRFFIFMISVGLLSSCHNLIVGRGNIIQNTSNLASDPFTQVELNADFMVYLTEDTFYQVKVQGYENLVPYVDIKKGGGRITLGVAQDYVFDEDNIVVYVTAPSYTAIQLNSNGSIIANDSITSTTLEVTNNGSGAISLFGSAQLVTAYSAGSGITRLCALQADTVSAFMLGSGILSTKPINKLNAQISGSGQIQYIGSPAMSFSNTGTGGLLQTLGCY